MFPPIRRQLPPSNAEGFDYILDVVETFGGRILSNMNTDEKLTLIEKADELLQKLEKEVILEMNTPEG